MLKRFGEISGVNNRLRVLILVGNDLVGDSRVQKIIQASIASGNKTFALARVNSAKQDPPGLELAKIIRIPLYQHSPVLHSGYSYPDRILRFLQRSWINPKAKVIEFRYRIKYANRRNKMRIKRVIFEVVNSDSALVPMKSYRHRLVAANRKRRETRLSQIASGQVEVSIESYLPREVVFPDFGKYLEKMHSWFVYPAISVKPDLIHANDADTLSIAVAVKDHWKLRGHDVAVIYDSHEFTSGVYRPNPTWLPAMESLEKRYIPQVDAVATVSGAIAKLLKDKFELPTLPTVILNAPSKEVDAVQLPFPSLRASLKLDDSVPLFVYVGVSAQMRGIHTAVEALKFYPDAHLAVITKFNNYVRSCVEMATDLGVDDRLHILPYVPQALVSTYISDATAGISPCLHHPNHELSCFTKFYEYLHAGLPIVTSDVQVMKETTLEFGVGTVFVAEDASDCAAQMKLLASGISSYKSAISQSLLDDWSWETQAAKLEVLYKSVL